jgi:DNA-binding transcriptional LysR family regulator
MALKCLEALARHRNYRRAALELGISQSQLSRNIQSLESKFGFNLFDRSRQGVSITPSGAHVLKEAAVVLNAHDAFADKVAKIRSRSREDLIVGAGTFASQTWAPKAIVALADARPEISIRLREMDWWKLAEAALSDEFHMVIGERSEADQVPEIKVEPFPERDAAFFVRAAHPLAPVTEVTLDQIAQFPLASVRLPSRASRVFPTGAKLGRPSEDGRYFFPKFECATPRSMIDVALESEAVCLALRGLCAEQLASGAMVELPLRARWLRIRQGLMYARGRPLSEAAMAFRTAAKVAERNYFSEPVTHHLGSARQAPATRPSE